MSHIACKKLKISPNEMLDITSEIGADVIIGIQNNNSILFGDGKIIKIHEHSVKNNKMRWKTLKNPWRNTTAKCSPRQVARNRPKSN